jgi:glycosyltransferase involved in cell wall biosynthesis
MHSFAVGRDKYEFRGFGRRKWELLGSAMRIARQARLAYIGHVHLAPLGLLMRLLNPRFQYWVASHGFEVWHPVSPLRRLALGAAQGITAVSAFTAAQIARAQGVDPRKVFLLPPALDPAFENADLESDSLPLPLRSRVILTVGRLVSAEPGKGVSAVIRALPKVLSVVPDCYYVVVGDGDYRPCLEQFAAENHVRDRVLFVGMQATSDLKKYYRRSDVFAMPSRQEGFGIVFLEAMAFGKPIIGGNHGGTPEIVKEGVTGYLVEYDRPDTLADRLIGLLQDEKLRARIGDAGRRWAEENFTFGHFRRRFAQLLESR